MPKLEGLDEIKPFGYYEYLYLLARFKTVEAENMGTPSRLPKLEHPLIECSVCHKLVDEPDIDMCEFCDEDVCDNCWDKHQCEEYDYE